MLQKLISALPFAAAAAALVAAPAAAAPSVVFAPNTNASAPHQGGGWNEPSGVVAADGSYYAAFQNAQSSAPYTTGLSRSTDARHWTQTGFQSFVASDPATGSNLGDVDMAADKAGTVFLSFIDGGVQAEITYTRDGGKTWSPATDVARLPAAASSSPFLVDRPWITVYSPDTDFHHTEVFLEYHDFGPSAVWVVQCQFDGTGTFGCGAPMPTSNPDSFCNTIPGGIAAAPAGSAHPGRVFAVWSTADVQTNAASGCNYTQLAPFYKTYVAWSDPPYTAWSDVPVYVGPSTGESCPGTSPAPGAGTNTCSDDSEIFNQIAVDSAGNAYVAFVDYIDTVSKHYDVYVASSIDGGRTWDGRADGTGRPHLVSSASGTHFFPAITAGDAGRIDVAYIGTPYTTTPYDQASSGCPSGVPPETSCQGKAQPEPPTAAWTVYLAQSLDADAPNPAFTEVRASDPGVVIHYGDVCNLGIYCDKSPSGNRSLWDAISVFTDRQGRAIVLWTDQRADRHGAADAAQANAQDPQAITDQVYGAVQVAGPTLVSSSVRAATATRLPFTAAPAGVPPAVPAILIAAGLLLALAGSTRAARPRPRPGGDDG